MADSVNHVTLLGNLGRDPDIRTTQAGDKIANLSLATSETWKDKNTGEKQERTEWHRVVIFGPLAEIAERYLTKGSKLYVQGQLQTRKWTDQAGVERHSTEVVLRGYGGKLVLLGGRGLSYDGDISGDMKRQTTERGPHKQREDYGELDDEIPF